MVKHTFRDKHFFMAYPSIIKLKEFRNRPSVAQGVPGGLGSQIFMTFGT
jgi:hypothetical protein